MQNKIALEEHFAIEETLGDAQQFVPGDYWSNLRARLIDFESQRLRDMDEHGIERMIVSLNAPAIQAIADTRRAIEIARKANDALAEKVAERKDRFSAFAALTMQD